MNIHFDLGETDFDFCIENIGGVIDIDSLDWWMGITCKVKNRFFNYHCTSAVDYEAIVIVCEKMDDLLQYRIEEETEITLIEPRMAFILIPEIDLRTLPGVYCTERYKPLGCFADLSITLTSTDGTYLGERYILTFNRAEVIAWRDFFKKALIEFDARKTI